MATPITLNDKNDKHPGTTGNDTVNGMGGNDTLKGESGLDSLSGGTGNDSLDGGAGNDTLDGGAGKDTLLGQADNDLLKGGADNDILFGATGKDTLDGGTGSDTLDGGDGDDFYIVDHSQDKVVEKATSAGGKDTVQASVTFTLGAALEHLTLTSERNLNGTGNQSDNKLTGNNGDNKLVGLGGKDTLSGGLGADTLDGGLNADRLIGGDGSDTYLINNTEDTIVETVTDGDVDRVISSATVKRLSDNVEALQLTGTLALNGTGNALDNQLEGNAGANLLDGAAGADTLSGGAGNDTLIGGLGDDSLDGGAGADTVTYTGKLAEYTQVYDLDNNSWTVTHTASGEQDQVVNVETLSFKDQTVDISAGPMPLLSVTDITQNEGNSGKLNVQFTLTLSAPAGRPVTVNYVTADGGADGAGIAAATAGTDYTATSGTVTFDVGERSKTVSVAVIPDALVEANEAFSLFLSQPVNCELGDPQAVGILTNDDQVLVSVKGATVKEGQTGTTNAIVTISLSAAANQNVTVDYSTLNGTAEAGSDFTASTGSLTFKVGETSKTVIIPVTADTTVESSETFQVQLANPVNAALSPRASLATVTITNDDFPSLSIADVTVVEGNEGVTEALVTVTLDIPATAEVTVNYATAKGTALLGTDFTATTGKLIFAPGETTKTIAVPVIADTNVEPDETFTLTLTKPTNAVLSTAARATITLTNDDLPSITFAADALAVSEDISTHTANLTVNLSAVSSQPVTVGYATGDGSASGSDFTALTDTLTFAPGELTKTLTVPISNDTEVEADETFSVTLSNPTLALLGELTTATVTITNDDRASLSIADVAVPEGAAGTANATVTVTLSSPVLSTVTVDYASSDKTAIVDSDYTAVTGTLTFAPGELTKAITVPVLGDATVETDETFALKISNPTNAVLGSASAIVTLTNDDLPTVGFGDDQTVTESDKDSVTASFTVTLSTVAASTVTVDYASSDGTATVASNDYRASSGTLTFKPGESSKTVTVSVPGDMLLETPETVLFTLSNPTGATLGKTTATLTIADNDEMGSFTLPVDSRSYDFEFPLTPEPDLMQGSAGPDKLLGLTGNDTLSGNTGNDHLDGGDDNDVLSGEDGDDYLLGGNGADTLDGAAGKDSLDGGAENDNLSGGSENDLLVGGFGNDTINGQVGDDSIDGGEGDDALEGWDGNDRMQGGFGNDAINGHYGDDIIDGGDGNDSLTDGAGSDLLIGGTGNDSLWANSGSNGQGNDTLLGGDGDDTLGNGYLLDGGSGNDVISATDYGWYTGAGATLLGGDGDDTISGYLKYDAARKNYVSGGEGNDKIDMADTCLVYGDAGNDTIYGSNGNDTLSGGTGDDSLTSDAGADSLNGGAGADSLTGGADADTFNYTAATDSGVGAANRDLITDFSSSGGDVISLKAIAPLATWGFLSTKPYTGAGHEINFAVDAVNKTTLVSIDLDGNKAPDMEIALSGIVLLSADDFGLK
ncbi:calcium-binding protein [Chromatium okenii]|uniref:calcium-binding protein n=1 Tax=Chromatium okenii TaxID=61644 RepID=UPI0011B094E3|nr:calcium-binding protein [Chromatium okenii]